jgi:hypothetical protein
MNSTLSSYAANKRHVVRITADISERWRERIHAQGLDRQGKNGAREYLRQYGRNIGVDKTVRLAMKAEEEGCLEMAEGFWEKAFSMERPPAAAASPVPAVTGRSRPQRVPMHVFPPHLVWSALGFRDPDRTASAEECIHHPRFWGLPLYDGQRCRGYISATGEIDWRSHAHRFPHAQIEGLERGMRRLARKEGPFVLEGYVCWEDELGGRHGTPERAARATGGPRGRIRSTAAVVFIAVRSLFRQEKDLTGETEARRIDEAADLAHRITECMIAEGVAKTGRVIPGQVFRTAQEKRTLANTLGDESWGLGELWIRSDAPYSDRLSDPPAVMETRQCFDSEARLLDFDAPRASHSTAGRLVLLLDANGKELKVDSVTNGLFPRDFERLAAMKKEDRNHLRILVRHRGVNPTGGVLGPRVLEIR